MEVLEHVPDPAAVLGEMARVSVALAAGERAARAAVARAEPGPRRSYVRELGQHPRPSEPLVEAGVREPAAPLRGGGRAALAAALDDGARTRRLVSRAGAGESAASYGRGAALLSALIGVTGLLTYAFHSIAAHVLGRRRLRADRGAVGGGVPGRVDHLPPGGAAAVAHDRRAARARAAGRRRAAGRGHDPARPRGRVRGRRAAAARPDRGRPVLRRLDALLVPDRGGHVLRGELLRARVPGRGAALRALRRAGADGGLVARRVRGAAGDRRRRQRERRRDRDRGRAAAEPVRGAVGARAARAADDGAGARDRPPARRRSRSSRSRTGSASRARCS